MIARIAQRQRPGRLDVDRRIMLVLGGVQLIMIGIVGEYLGPGVLRVEGTAVRTSSRDRGS